MSPGTEEAYVEWIPRCSVVHGKGHPELGVPQRTRFLSDLPVEGSVASPVAAVEAP